jgi:hypothetical protein
MTSPGTSTCTRTARVTKSDRTIPFLTDETPRYWRARYICRKCRADHERRWLADD